MIRRAVLLCAALASAAALFGRGGGGCLERGTLIDTPAGRVAIEHLHVGDVVWGCRQGERIRARVDVIYRVEPEHYIELTAGGSVLRATPEHPIEVAPGVFVRADRLVAGQENILTRLGPQSLATVRTTPATEPAFNLMVSPGGVFWANGVAVHNKGCFLPETPITMSDGSRRMISGVHGGDDVMAFEPDGRLVRAVVRNVITHEVQSYLELRTASVEVHVTEEHPFYVGDGTFKTAEALRVGDTVFVYDGHVLTPQPIVALERVRANVTVYNLQTDAPHTFLADGIAVHNKGGGFGGGGFHGGGFHGGLGGGSSGSGGSPLPFLGLLVFVIFFLIAKAKSRRSDDAEELDYCYSRSDIEGKAKKTAELLRFISKVDAAWDIAALQARTREVFTKLQSCWAAREYGPMQPLMMPDLYEQHCAQLRGLRETHEINRIDQLQIEAVDLVHVNYTDRKADRAFTALITARARDYYVDDRTHEFIRGDSAPQRFQEFWTFQLGDGAWELREIEQTKESDVLTTENLFEQFTDVGRDQIYGATAGQSGPAGPALPKDVELKANKIDRLLNFLVQTDKIWNREEMLATARRVFLNVQLAWQDGRPAMLAGAALAPELEQHIRSVMETNQTRGMRVEHRNLCVRKVEIVHVDNRDDRTLDAFTARISAHAQTIITGPSGELRHDEWVKAWTDYWVFGRDGSRWVLKEILPEAGGEAAVARENVDEGSSQQMLEWYYSKPRAT